MIVSLSDYERIEVARSASKQLLEMGLKGLPGCFVFFLTEESSDRKSRDATENFEVDVTIGAEYTTFLLVVPNQRTSPPKRGLAIRKTAEARFPVFGQVPFRVLVA